MVSAESKLSDHKGFFLERHQPSVENIKVKPSPKYHRPTSLASKNWNEILEIVWTTQVVAAEEYKAICHALQTRSTGLNNGSKENGIFS